MPQSAIEIFGPVAESFGERASHLEVKLTVGSLRNVPVDRFDFAFEFAGVE